MSIQKKSLISTLQTAKKANVAAEHKGEKQVSAVKVVGFKGATTKAIGHNSTKGVASVSARSMKSFKKQSLRLVQ